MPSRYMLYGGDHPHTEEQYVFSRQETLQATEQEIARLQRKAKDLGRQLRVEQINMQKLKQQMQDCTQRLETLNRDASTQEEDHFGLTMITLYETEREKSLCDSAMLTVQITQNNIQRKLEDTERQLLQAHQNKRALYIALQNT